MSAQKLFDEILPIRYTVKEVTAKLQKILQFLLDEIHKEPLTPEETDRFYNDDGNKLNPETMPVSSVCMIWDINEN